MQRHGNVSFDAQAGIDMVADQQSFAEVHIRVRLILIIRSHLKFYIQDKFLTSTVPSSPLRYRQSIDAVQSWTARCISEALRECLVLVSRVSTEDIREVIRNRYGEFAFLFASCVNLFTLSTFRDRILTVAKGLIEAWRTDMVPNVMTGTIKLVYLVCLKAGRGSEVNLDAYCDDLWACHAQRILGDEPDSLVIPIEAVNQTWLK
jgi:hypothetical protein